PPPGPAGRSLRLCPGPRVLWAPRSPGLSPLVLAGLVPAPVPPARLLLRGFLAGLVRPPGPLSPGSLWPVLLA
ncbi:hypothetical protein C3R44_24060, partial [Mycobacterium tuberculosis]